MKIKIGDIVVYTDNVRTLAAENKPACSGWRYAGHNRNDFPITKHSVVFSKLIILLFAK